MDILGWIIVIALFVTGMAGAVFPVLPGVLAIYAAFSSTGGFSRSRHWARSSGLSRR